MSGIKTLHDLLLRRTSTYALTIVGAAFFFERTFDISVESVFDQLNKGKQWKDIKNRYIE